MSNLTTRAGKGSPLTNNELDANFTNLNSDKVEIGGDLSGTSSAPNVAKIQGRAVSADAPAIGEKLVWNGAAWEPSTDPTGEPIGHEDKTKSSISFDSGTRTFTIAPVSTDFVVWCKGVKHTYSTAQTVVIPNTTGLHFIYFNASGVLSTQMSYFTWEEHAPTAYVYWNSTTQQAVYFGDERHGITLDWQTHEYLHRTRGAAIASGFGASGYTTTGAGSTDADAQIDIGGGTFFDEDLQVDIVSTNTPVAGTWQQDLSGPARIPVLYLNGSAWVIDAPTDFPFKVVSGVPQYNLYSGGTWSSAPVANNGYFVSWILATHNLTYPVIAVISQAATNQVSEAEAMTFEGLTLSGFPSVEFRPLYKVIYQHKTSFSNNIKASTIAVYDLRSISAAGVAAALVQDHGNLSGLGDDDHAQYLHVSAVRSPSAAVTNSFLPSQASQSGKYLTTDGSNPSWGSIPSGSLTFTGDVTGTGTTGSSTTLTLSNSGAAAGTYTKVTVDAKGRVTTGALIDSSDVTTALGFTPENSANKAVANGYASLDGSGKVPSTQLPSYVDDVIEYANLAAFPATGESGKIYIAIDTAKTYRWSGSAYVEISASPGSTDAVTEGSTNLYFTNARARGAITATGSLSYNNQTGVLSYTQPTNVSTFTNDSGYLTGITGTQVATALGYTPPQPNGTGATGTWNISISGNAATVSSITSAQVTTALGYTPYNATNPAGYTTNVGTVTSVSGTGTVSGLTLTGSVTSSGSLTLGGTLSLTSGQVTSALGFTPYNATNPSGYITGITSGMVTTALGYTPYNSSNPSGYITSSSNITGTAAGITGYTLADVTGTATSVMTRNSSGDSAVGSRFHFTTCTADGGNFALVGLNWGGAAGTYKDFEVYDYPNSRPLFRAFGSTRNFEVYGTLTAPNFADSTGTYNVNLGGINGRGAAAGYSGGAYGGVGYNVRHTATAEQYVAPTGDTVSYLRFDSGGFRFFSATAGAAGRTVTLSGSGNAFLDASGNWYAAGQMYATGSQHLVLNTGNYNDYAPSKTGTGASGTWGINITGSAGSASNSTTVGGLSPAQLFNNMGNNHGSPMDFNNIPGYGSFFVQGTTNGPGTGAGQFYGITLGLGNDYAYSSFALQLAIPRYAYNVSSDRYLSIRNREGGTWSAWSKISAGYADTAGSATDSTKLPLSGGTLTGGLGVGTIIGSRGTALSVSGSSNSSAIVAKSSDYATVSSILPHSASWTYYGTGVYYNNGAWVHASADSNNALFGINGSVGGSWWASSTGTASWNVASGTALWNAAGTWVGSLNAAAGAQVNSSVILTSANYSSYALPLSGGTVSGDVRVTNKLSVGGSTTDLRFGVAGETHLTGYVYLDLGGTLGNYNTWSGRLSSSGGVTRINTSSFVVDRTGYGSGNILEATSSGYVLGGGKFLADAWVQSDRDFPNGTLITTDINYAVTNGDPFILEIRGNTYGNIVPLDIQYQGYIYYDTIINHGGISNGLNISGLVAINNGGNLCFWFPSQGYWNGYYVRVYVPYATYPRNRVTSITHVAKPTTAKQVDLSANIRQSLHSGNFTSYALPISGGTMTGHLALSDNRLYLRTNGDTNHYLWNAADDWEELVAYFGTGFRVQASNGSTIATFATGNTYIYSPLNTTDVINLSYNITGSVATSARRGIELHNPGGSDYWIGKRAGAWTQPLDVSFYTGIRYHAHASYGGHKFYTSGYDTSYNFSVGDGDSNVRVYSNLYVSGDSRGYDVYTTGGWFRNHTNNNGIYWSQSGWHLYPASAGDFYVRSGTSSGSLLFLNSGGSGLGYLHCASDSAMGFLTSGGNWRFRVDNSSNARFYNNLYLDQNYGHGIVGVYSSYRYQGVFSMGDAYKLPADGTTTGNLYGMAWSHPNAGGVAGNLDSHGLLVLINGGFGSAMSYSIVASGNVTAYSDERLKTNWREMPENYVERLAQVKVGIYDRIDGEKITQVGIGAQSFQRLLPEAITKAADEIGTLSVSYGNAAMASAVELAKELVMLKKELAEIKSRLH